MSERAQSRGKKTDQCTHCAMYHIFMEKPPMKVLLCILCNVPTFCGIDMLFCVRRSLFPSQSRFGGFFHLRPDFVGGSDVKHTEWKSRLTGTEKKFVGLCSCQTQVAEGVSDTTKKNPQYNFSPGLTHTDTG